MQKKFINNFLILLKFFFNYPRKLLRYLIFDFKNQISQFSIQSLSIQKKELINLISKENFTFLDNFIKNKQIENLNGLFINLKKKNHHKKTFIFIYSYLVNICEYRAASIFHNFLCKSINKKSFFYFQICTLNQRNISKFRLYIKTFKFKIIYHFLLYKDEKNYIQTILNFNSSWFKRNYKINNEDKNYKKYLKGKNIYIIGPLNKKIKFSKKELKDSLIIRFKNTNFLKSKDYYPQIIYLNGTASKQYFKKKNFLSRNKGLVWVVYINKTFYKNYKKNDDFKKRFADNTSSILFTCFTELNLLQKVLLDLSLFELKRVKLFNFDIKLSKKTLIGYGIHNTLKRQMRNIITFNHNQIVMFDFINFLYEKKIIFLDKHLKKIIYNGKDKYLKRLEQTWRG